ncbi:MAG: hypothetical protein SAJ37_22980 [Oscillatoria sp. PMC 1068.18]|nr:hypothetical protein [Oscillatoria sp. PMC 1076.18]MEC4991610.1 hypothetical protein [Oscillatoria sp. PMC 1068.18]
MQYQGDVAAIIVNRNRPDLTDSLVEQLQNFGKNQSKDIFVIECGSDEDKQSKYASFYYPDPEFRGKCYGHNRGLQYVLEEHGRYKYYWFLMNDLVFESEPDPIDKLIEILAAEPRMGIISPTERDSNYPSSRSQSGRRWHKVSTCDYLALMMKDECLREVGFLNQDFLYSRGAIYELSYKMYRDNWFIAYCDEVVMKHLGGTTYGATADTISREEYLKKARLWAANYFRNTYGEAWEELFSKYLSEDIEINTYKKINKKWNSMDETGAIKKGTSQKSFLKRLKSSLAK